ncbi:DUF7927 domain-containing protein [Desertihabitans aurantiacus]|uniref:DUF7927 domain-containing protein n=1 Tax=Desertihabitans aurantiacus TaxID=2282477 RepID=UPI0013001F0E|nr:GEVED domain-containing protein [Desertihabitans aurantiacus]
MTASMAMLASMLSAVGLIAAPAPVATAEPGDTVDVLAAGATDYADWTTPGPNAVFTFSDGTTGTVELEPTECGTPDGGSPTNIGAIASMSAGAAPNFPGAWYTPALPDPVEMLSVGSSTVCPDNAVTGTMTITFDQPVTDPVFHLYNLDAAQWRFQDGTLTKLSGNDALEVVGSTANETNVPANGAGCNADDDALPPAGCGSVQLTGTFDSISIDLTDIDEATSGDGHSFTVSVQPDPPVCGPGGTLVPVDLIQNPSFESRTGDFQNSSAASTIGFATGWQDSHPTGGQYHYFSPTFDSGPGAATMPLRAGAEGYGFMGGHSSGGVGEGATNTLLAPLDPLSTYVGYYSIAAGGYSRQGDGYMQFFGVSDPDVGSIPGTNVVAPTPANSEPLFSTPVTEFPGAGATPEWEQVEFTLNASQPWSYLRVEVRNADPAADGTVAGQTWVNFDDFHLFECQYEVDFGDAPESYDTLLADDGARHNIVPGLSLGADVDGETDGQPGAAADGDGADEDGLVSPDELTFSGPTVTVAATNDTGEPATLAGWVDLDADGTFEDSERVLVPVPAGSGADTYTLQFPQVATGSSDSMARFRLFPGDITDPSPTGHVLGGEVEDHAVTFAEQAIWQCEPTGLLFQNPNATPPLNIVNVDLVTGDTPAPQIVEGWTVNGVGYNVQDDYIYGWGTHPDTSRTGLVRVGSDGSVVFLGMPTGDADAVAAFPGGGAVGDVDPNNQYWSYNPNNGDWFQVDLATNTLVDWGNAPTPGLTSGVDWAFVPGTNKLWRLPANAALGSTSLIGFDITTHTWTTPVDLGPVSDNVTGATFADPNGNLYASYNSTGEIWRVDTETNTAALLAPEGPISAGNDGARCANAPLPIDFGDAPAGYGTELVDDGPRHGVPDYDAATGTAPLMLGSSIDIDLDGVPTPDADGDDTTGADDEDAVSGPIQISANAPVVSVSATNDTGAAATLAGWVDLDGDGSFEESERVTVEVPASSGTADYTLTFPAATATSGVFARFRLFPGTETDRSPLGNAGAGEVEDYAVLVRSLEVDKTFGATAETRIGDTVTYTVTVHNPSEVAYTAEDPARVQDDLSGVLDDATYNDDETATGGTVSYAEPRLTWSGALAPDETVTITYSVTLTGAGDQSVDNTAFQTVCPADEPDCDPTPPQECVDGVDPATGLACDSVEFLLPKLDITKTADRTELPGVGETVGYTVTATNSGEAPFTATRPAVVLDDLSAVLDDATGPDGLTADLGAAPTFSDPLITWAGELAVGETVTITYTVTYTGAGDTELVNVAFGPQCGADDPNCDTPPPTPACDPADENGLDPETGLPCDRVTVPGALLEVTKTVDPASGTTVSAGEELTYTITFANNGIAEAVVDGWTDALTNVVDDAEVTEGPSASDEDLTVSAITDDRFTVTGTVPAGESSTVTYTVEVLPDGERGNNVLGNFVLPPGVVDPPTECEDGNGLCTENPVAEIVDSKSVAPESGTAVLSGQEITYTLTFANIGEGPGAVDRADDLTHVLDDADLVGVPVASDPALSVSELVAGRYTITGELAADQTVTVSYTVVVRDADEMGDATLANFLVDPTDPPIVEPVCEEGDEDCTSNPAPKVLDSKSVDPETGTEVVSGEELTYTLTFTNEGTAAGAVDRVDDLTHLLDDADLVEGPTASDDALTVSDIVGGRFTVTGDLAVDQTVTVTYTVVVREAEDMGDATLANFLLDPTDPTPEEPVCEEGSEDCTTNPAPKVLDSKSVAPETGTEVEPGQELTYTLTFSNEGSAAGAVDRVDDLTHLLDDATITTEPTASDESLTVSEIVDGRFGVTGELAAGQSVRVSYTATIDEAAELGDGQVANFLLDPADPTPEEPVCAEGSEDCTFNPIPNVVDSKSVDPETGSEVASGEELTYTLTFANIGQAPAVVDRVDDLSHLLDDAQLVEGPTASDDALSVGEVVDGRFAITGELAADQTVTVTYTVVVKDAEAMGDGALANFLLDPADPTPEEPVCEEGSEDCTTNPAAKVVDSKSVDPETGASVQAGSELTYTLTFSNEGSAAGSVDRVDDLTHVLDDAEITSEPVASDDALSVSELAEDRYTITGELAAGQTVTVSYTVTVLAPDEQGDSQLANFLLDPEEDSPSEPVCEGEDCTFNPVSDITVSKSVDPATGSEVQQGDELSYTLTFTNTGAGEGVVDHTDHMAGVLDDATVTEFPTPSEDVLTVAEGDDQYTVQGTLAAGQTVTVSYTVQVRDWDEQGDHRLVNFVTPTGQESPAGAECVEGSELCTENPVQEPGAPAPDPEQPPAPDQPPAQSPDGGQLPDTGAPSAMVAALLGGLVLVLIGSGVLVARRRRLAGLRLEE